MQLNQLLNARFAKGIRSIFGLEEQEGVTSVAPELQVVALLEAFQYRFNLNVLSFGRSFEVPADAGNPSSFQLRNPLNSGVIAIIERIQVYTLSAQQIVGGVLGDPVVDLGTLATATVRDTRSLVSQRSTCIASFGPGAFAGSGHVRAAPVAITGVEWLAGWVLRPGDAFEVSGASNNISIVGAMQWFEQPVRPTELVA